MCPGSEQVGRARALAPLQSTSGVPRLDQQTLHRENKATWKKRQEKHSFILITNSKLMHELFLYQQVFKANLEWVEEQFRKTEVKIAKLEPNDSQVIFM